MTVDDEIDDYYASRDDDIDSPPYHYNHDNDSAMRRSFSETPSESRAIRRKFRKERILKRRGAFVWLPILCSNDLVHGSWWFVVGSMIAMIIPIVPLLDLFYPFWSTEHGTLPLLEDAATFGLLIISGLFFTLGSLAFVRATEEPPLKPLFNHYSMHLATDELLAAWLFLFGTIPFVPFIAVYVYYNPTVLVYWGSLVASIFFNIATYLFVLSCYPSEEKKQSEIISDFTIACFGESCWIQKHLRNDWLAATWIFFYGTLIMCLGSGFMMAMAFNSNNQLEIFDWVISLADSIIFLIGSAYFCAGSYPQELLAYEPTHIGSETKHIGFVKHSGGHSEADSLVQKNNRRLY